MLHLNQQTPVEPIQKKTESQPTGIQSKPEANSTQDEQPELFCFCWKPAAGDMVQCSYPYCKLDWFHFPCMGLRTEPKGNWFCSSTCELLYSVALNKTRDEPESNSDWEYNDKA